MKLAALLLVALVAAPALGRSVSFDWTTSVAVNGVHFDSDANVTFVNADDFNFRRTYAWASGNFADIVSESIVAEETGSSSGDAQAEFGLLFVSTLLSPPVVVQTLADVSASWSGGASSGDFSFDDAVSTVITVYESLNEVDANGNVVATHDLSGLNLKFANSGAVKTSTSDNGSKLYYFSLNTTSSTVPLSITFVASEVVGVLNIGDAPVSPKGVETIVELTHYTLASSSNHLELQMLVATAVLSSSGDGEVTEDFQLIQGEGSSQAYFQASGTATVSGKVHEVDVSVDAAAEADISGSAAWLGLALELTGDFSGELTVKRVYVDFGAGVNSFTYDPSSGFEAPQSDSASSLAPRILPLFALVSALFAAVFNI